MELHRTCQFCKEQDIVYDGCRYVLLKYGVRHYAHAICLAKARGIIGGRSLIPEHERMDYDRCLSLAKAADTKAVRP